MTDHLNGIQRLCTNLDDDPEFVVGEIYGLRQWTLTAPDDTGHRSLIGHNRYPWSPYETNVAECDVTRRDYRGGISVDPLRIPENFIALSVSKRAQEMLEDQPEAQTCAVQLEGSPKIFWVARGAPVEQVLPWNISQEGVSESFTGLVTFNFYVSVPIDRSRHKVTSPECTCGFYAYTDPDSLLKNSTSGEDKFFGLIKAYGLVTQGTKGFRAEKAEIVGLTYPASHSFRAKREEFQKLIPDNIPIYDFHDNLLQVAKKLISPDEPW